MQTGAAKRFGGYAVPKAKKVLELLSQRYRTLVTDRM